MKILGITLLPVSGSALKLVGKIFSQINLKKDKGGLNAFNWVQGS